MKRMALVLGAGVALLSACAPYGAYDNGYYGGSGGYDGPAYYGARVTAQPYEGSSYNRGYQGGYGGRDHDRGNHQGYRSDNDRHQGNWNRDNNQPQANAQTNGDHATRGNWRQNQSQQTQAPSQPADNGGQGRGFRHRDN